jgi:hypothetical protein
MGSQRHHATTQHPDHAVSHRRSRHFRGTESTVSRGRRLSARPSIVSTCCVATPPAQSKPRGPHVAPDALSGGDIDRHQFSGQRPAARVGLRRDVDPARRLAHGPSSIAWRADDVLVTVVLRTPLTADPVKRVRCCRSRARVWARPVKLPALGGDDLFVPPSPRACRWP